MSSRNKASVTQQPSTTPPNAAAIDTREATNAAAAYSAAASRVAESSAGLAKRPAVGSLDDGTAAAASMPSAAPKNATRCQLKVMSALP